MAAKPRIVSDLEVLRQDASKVMADISKISNQLGSSATEQGTVDASPAAIGPEEPSVKEQTAALLEEATRKFAAMREQLSGQASKADRHVRDNPYLYAGVAAGLGFVLGKLLLRRRTY